MQFTLAHCRNTWRIRIPTVFDKGRSCADALGHCFDRFCQQDSRDRYLKPISPACFDDISHQWILDNIPVDKKILKQWLNAGFLDKGELFPTLKGTPQGGIISPILMNMTLDGLEERVEKIGSVVYTRNNNRTGVTVIRYADDFIVTARPRNYWNRKFFQQSRNS